MKKPIEDLDGVDPKGRFDVLLFRGAEMLTKHIEESNGLSGIWDAMKPHVNEAIAGGMKGVEIPTEGRLLLQILQANMQKKID